MVKKLISIFIAVVLATGSLAFSVNAAPKKVKAKSISIKKTLTMKKGSSKTLKCTLKPKNVTVKKVKWTSSNTKIVTVSAKGKLKAKKSGIAVITASTKDGTKLKAKCTVTVLNKTVNQTVKDNLNALKDHILEKGDTNSSGEAGIFGEYSDDEEKDDRFDDIYSIRYLPKKKMFKFGFSSEFTTDDDYKIKSIVTFDYSLTAFDYITAENLNIGYDDDDIDYTYSADISAAVASYNPDSTIPSIKITSNTSSISSEKIKTYINSDFKAAMTSLNSLLFDETGMTLSDIGFKNY